MDIRTLPENERQIYNRIRQQHKVIFEKFRVADTTIRLLKIADLEEFLAGKDPFANISEFPFWIRLWDAAIILAYVLQALPDKNGRKLLELGAGLGAPGLVAAAAGFSVTLTDYEDIILDFQRVSAAASKLESVECRMLDWLNPPKLTTFEVLAGAEILFREEFFEPLLNVFSTYLAENGRIYLAHDASRQSLPRFLRLAEKDFRIATQVQKIQREGKDITIIVNCLRRKTAEEKAQ